MGKRTGGGGPSATKVKGPPRYWCYYCDTRHEGELQLIQHQRHKHFLCRLCDPKSYGRNCLSLSGLISHVRRSHRQEITEVPGAIEGRRSTDVEISGMNGIPPQALDSFEEKIAEEMLAYWPGRGVAAAEPPPDSSEEEEEPAPAKEPVKPKEDDKKDAGGKRPVVVPDMAWIASQLATSDGQYNNLELERPSINLPGLPTPAANKDIKAFDPSLLAQVAAGNQVPVMVEERQNLAREEEEAKNKAEEKVRKDEEKRRRSIAIAFLPTKKDKEEPIVPKIDKSVVSDLGSAIQARAAMAKASETAKSNFKTVPQTLKNRLVAMQPGALLKFAVEAGVVKDDIMKANGSKDVIAQLILNLDTEESWKTIAFKPGKIGLKADWARGEVESVTADGQGDILGVKVGWIFRTIDGERFSKAALQDKIGGVLDYKAVFATSEAALGKSRTNGGGRYGPGGLLRLLKKKQKAEKEAAEKPQGEEEEYEYTEDEGEQADGQAKKGKRRHRQRAAEEDHCLPGECDEEEHCLPGEEEAEEGAGGDDSGRRKAKETRRRDHEPEDHPRKSRRFRDNGAEDDYRDDRRRRRHDDRRRYEYEDDDYEEDDEEEEEYERRRARGRRGRREDYEYEDDRRGRDRRPRGREREEEYDPDEEYPEEEEEAPKGDPGRKRGVQRLLPREEKVAAK